MHRTVQDHQAESSPSASVAVANHRRGRLPPVEHPATDGIRLTHQPITARLQSRTTPDHAPAAHAGCLDGPDRRRNRWTCRATAAPGAAQQRQLPASAHPAGEPGHGATHDQGGAARFDTSPYALAGTPSVAGQFPGGPPGNIDGGGLLEVVETEYCGAGQNCTKTISK